MWPRLQIWSFGWKAFLDRPITGYGLNRYRPAVQRFFTPEFARREASTDLIQTWYDPHNVVVQVAVSLGAVGLALFAWFLVSAGRRSRGPLLWGATGMAFCWLMQPPSHATYALAALLLGASQLEVGGDGGAVMATRAPKVVTTAACVTALVLVTWGVVGDLTLKNAYDSGDLADARRATAWNPVDAMVFSTVSTAVLDPTDVSPEVEREVLRWSERATELEPGLPFMWAELGIRQLLFGDVQGARASLEHAIELQPYHQLSLVVLRNIAEREGDDELLALVTQRLNELDLPTPAVELEA